MGPDLELEQVVKRLSRIVGARRGGFPFDGGAGRVERAAVPGVLGRDARGNLLHALEATARIEGGALRARVEIHAAARTAAVEADVTRDDGPALRTANDLAIPRHVDVAGAILRDTARASGRARFGCGPLGFRGCRSIPVVVLIPPLTVLPVAHQVAVASAIVYRRVQGADRRVHPVCTLGHAVDVSAGLPIESRGCRGIHSRESAA